jgi:hypothetical protein
MKKIALVSGLFINKEERKASYDLINEWMKSLSVNYHHQGALDLDAIDKAIVFFNLGLNLSFKRFKQGRPKTYSSVHSRKEMILDAYKRQQVPSQNEFPNLEIVVIKEQRDVEKAVEGIIDFFQE